MNVTSQNSIIFDHLQILELSKLPDSLTLQKQFKELLKHYHPDRNSHRKKWAHEKTLALISSNNNIREYLQQEEVEFNITNEPGFQQREAAEKSATNFQLIDGEEINYAIPLNNIIRIFSARNSIVKKSTGYYFSFENRIAPVISLNGKAISLDSTQFVILYKSGKSLLGLAVPADMKLNKIEKFTNKEQVYIHADHVINSGWLMFREKYYFFPENIMHGGRNGR